MSCIRVLPFSLLTILLIFSLTFVVALSSEEEEESHFLTFQTVHSSGLFGEQNHRLVGSWGKRRFLDEDLSASDEPPLNSSLILAAKRTNRKDPLNDFKKYNGGWNISNKHYWASVAYTAVPFFLVAGIWFVVFGLCLLIMVFYFCCCRKEPYGYSRVAYALSLILLILFTVVAIVGCIILYLGQGKFYNSTTDTLEYVVDQANTTSKTLRDVSGYLAAAKDVKVLQVILPANVQGDIDQVQAKIDSASTTLSDKALDNAKDIKDLINSVRLALIILSAVMLFMTFLGFVFSIFGMQFLVYILVVSGWILVAGTFILCGIFLLLHNVTEDTCVSMDQWVRNPTAHTSLDDILPCVDNATAQDTLTKSREVTSQLVDVVNQVITNVSNINFSPNFAPMYYNQSGPLLPLLCNPFQPDFTNRTCTPGEVDLNNATQVWSNYVCQVSPNGICLTTGRLTPEFYRQMSAGVNVSYGLYHFGPYLASLQDCSYVRQTFSEIHSNYCPGLETYTKLVYIGLVMVASAVMLSLLFWVIYGRERRHRVYTKEHMPMPRSSADIYGDKS